MWLWGVLAVIAIAAGAVWFFQPWVSKGLAVKVETVTPTPLTRVLAVNGRIAPLHLVEVKPTVGGRMTTVLVDEGDAVVAGDVLARVDATQQQAAVRQSLAGLDAGLVSLSQAQGNLGRAEALGGTITRTALQDARAAQQTASQEVARLTALFDQTQIELAKYTLIAPMAGTILTRNAEVGQVVDASKAVFTVADLAELVVETDVDEAYAARIIPDLAAILQLTGSGEKLDGHVRFVAPQVDAATGGLAVKIAFDRPIVAPVGLTVTANIVVDQQDAALSVPRAAVVTDATGAAVFVASNGLAERRGVTVVDWPADRLQVTQGLVVGDAVITDAIGLSDGLAITLPDAPDGAL
jgi:RND family efflux transporter MFP subunit